MKSFNPNKTPSTNATLVVTKINELERQILDGKLALVDEYGKLLEMKVTNEASASKPSTSIGDHLVESDEGEVKFPDYVTFRYMSLTGEGAEFCEGLILISYDGSAANISKCGIVGGLGNKALRDAGFVMGGVFVAGPHRMCFVELHEEGTLGGCDNGEFRYPLVEGDDKRVGDFGV
ncbi:hypothetical protein Tco_0620367 [Tanacetum coccineum]